MGADTVVLELVDAADVVAVDVDGIDVDAIDVDAIGVDATVRFGVIVVVGVAIVVGDETGAVNAFLEDEDGSTNLICLSFPLFLSFLFKSLTIP